METIVKDYLECEWCGRVFSTPHDFLKVDNKLFCCNECLGEYLVEKMDGEIESIWFDTPTNIEQREKEKKAEW